MGWRVQGLPGFALADEDHHADDRAVNPDDPFRPLWKRKVPADHFVQRRGDPARRWSACTTADGNEFQRLFTARICRTDGRSGSD